MPISETGLVESTSPGKAVIVTTRSEACNHCGAKGACTAMGGGKENRVEVDDPVGVTSGQKVEIVMSSRSFLAATFLLYMVPCLGLLLGSVLGRDWLAPCLGWNESAGAILGALGLAAVGLALGLCLGKPMGKKKRYRPQISRVVSQHNIS